MQAGRQEINSNFHHEKKNSLRELEDVRAATKKSLWQEEQFQLDSIQLKFKVFIVFINARPRLRYTSYTLTVPSGSQLIIDVWIRLIYCNIIQISTFNIIFLEQKISKYIRIFHLFYLGISDGTICQKNFHLTREFSAFVTNYNFRMKRKRRENLFSIRRVARLMMLISSFILFSPLNMLFFRLQVHAWGLSVPLIS